MTGQPGVTMKISFHPRPIDWSPAPGMTLNMSQRLSPYPSPFAWGTSGATLSPLSLHCYHVPMMPPESSQNLPIPLPFSGGSDMEGGLSFQCPLPSSLIGPLARPYRWLKQNYYLFTSWFWEVSFGKFMTIFDLWYLVAKSFKNFTGGKEDISAIVIASINTTKTLHVEAMSSLSSRLWTIDAIPI